MKTCALSLAVAMLASSPLAQANAFSDGHFLGDFRLRYEQNDTDNALKTANAFTLRSRVGFETAAVNGWSFLVEASNTSALEDHYAPETAGYNVVPDPTDTDWNRIQLSYKNGGFSGVLGRQRIIFDNARMVGNVGWRQQEQTFDALKLGYAQGALNLQYAYIDKVHTPAFVDLDAGHHLFNLSYSPLDNATITAYSYLLRDKNTAKTIKNDTNGVRFAGKEKLDDLSIHYTMEYARQKTSGFSASYQFAEAGLSGARFNAALGYELLGSDNRQYGFQTPLATKHAFNGWADKFGVTPADGLDDRYLKLGTQVSGVALTAFYHDYKAAKGGADYGDEINLMASYGFAEHYSVGAKYARYKQGDANPAFADTDKFWLWLEAKF